MANTVEVKQPFKLIPVMPPNKDKSVAVKSKHQLKTSDQDMRTKLKALSHTVPPVEIASSMNQNPLTSTRSSSTEAIMLVDQAIIAVVRKESIDVLSTHDRSPYLSFGEKVRSRASAKPDVESAISGSLNEPITTPTTAVMNQMSPESCENQQTTNSVADQIAPALISAILENDNSTSPLTSKSLAEDSSSKKSTELLFREQPNDDQLSNELAELAHAAPTTQGSIAQSTQSYNLTATSSCSLTTPIRDSSPR